MNKTTILQALFETIDESLDWALGSKDEVYSCFINGAMNMTKNLLEKIKTEDSPTTIEIGYGLGKENASRTKIIDGDSLAM